MSTSRSARHTPAAHRFANIRKCLRYMLSSNIGEVNGRDSCRGAVDPYRPCLRPARPLADGRRVASHHLQQAAHGLRESHSAPRPRTSPRVPARRALGRCRAGRSSRGHRRRHQPRRSNTSTRRRAALLDEAARRTEVTVVPGNHDIYLPSTHRDRRFPHHFDRFVRSDLPELARDLPAGRFPCVKLRGGVAIIAPVERGATTAVRRRRLHRSRTTRGVRNGARTP